MAKKASDTRTKIVRRNGPSVKQETQPLYPRDDEAIKRVQEGLQAENERLQKLVTGKIKPPNSTVKYLVDKYRESRASYEEIAKQAVQMRGMLQEAEKRLLVLQGQTNSYASDIRNWDKEVVEESGKGG